MIDVIIHLLADGAVVPILLIAAYALLFKIPKGGRLSAYSRILFVGLTAYLLAKLLGAAYQPATMRPFEIMGVQAGASYLNNPGFPSDHALFTAFLTLIVWFETRSKTLTLTMAILTILVCAGRILALVHTPLDVIGGISVALFASLWYLQPGFLSHARKKDKTAV